MGRQDGKQAVDACDQFMVLNAMLYCNAKFVAQGMAAADLAMGVQNEKQHVAICRSPPCGCNPCIAPGALCGQSAGQTHA